MSTVEDHVRSALHEIASEARSAPLLQRLEATRPSAVVTRRLVSAVAVVVVVLIVAALAIRSYENRPITPVDQPPKVLTLSGDSSLRPGRVQLALTLAADSENDNTPAYLLPRGTTEAVLLPVTGSGEGQWMQQLSVDGLSFVRQSWSLDNPSIEIVDLRTGRVDDAGGALARCATLSPDGALLAGKAASGSDVVLIDRESGSAARIGANDAECGYSSFGWSPDGDRLVMRKGDVSELRDRRGRLMLDVPGWTLANGSMSWSPDGGDLLMYRSSTGEHAIVSADDGSVSTIRPPTTSTPARPVGWTGDRVVWLTGGVGEQRLVSTDRAGHDRRLWTRLDLGSQRLVENVSWSRDLTGG